MRSEKPRVVEIEWVDAASARGWCRAKEATDEDGGLSRVFSVGFLVAQDKQSVSISTSRDCGGKFVDILSIPRAAITKMKIKKEAGG